MNEQFAQAVHRQSAMLLDNIGIRVSFAELPSAAEYREAKRVWYGTNWLSRLWCRKLRPVLFPHRHNLARQHFEAMRLLTQQEMMVEVLRQGEELVS